MFSIAQNIRSTRCVSTHAKSRQQQTRRYAFAQQNVVCSSKEKLEQGPFQFVSTDRRQAIMIGTSLATGLLSAGNQEALAIDNPLDLGNGTKRVFGEATSASSYGGYGGNDQGTELDSFKYWFDVPTNWKAEIVTKQEKGYQGVDVRYSDPQDKKSRAFMVTFPGYTGLKSAYEEILDDLALADSKLQDALALAEEFKFEGKQDAEGLLYVDYLVRSEPESFLARLQVYNRRLYAMLVWADSDKFEKQLDTLENIRGSFRCVKQTPEQMLADLRYFRQAVN